MCEEDSSFMGTIGIYIYVISRYDSNTVPLIPTECLIAVIKYDSQQYRMPGWGLGGQAETSSKPFLFYNHSFKNFWEKIKDESSDVVV